MYVSSRAQEVGVTEISSNCMRVCSFCVQSASATKISIGRMRYWVIWLYSH